MRTLLAFLLLTSTCYAGNNILNLTGNNNTITTTQVGNPSINFSATNLNNSSVSFDQQGGGSHTADIELFGSFDSYVISVTQNSTTNQSFSIQQYCGISSCNPYPLIVNQY
jgi:hypothetical protein